MPLQPSWLDLAVRLALTMLAAGVIGYDRETRGHAAGFRTTILVGVAAALAMIEANLLLSASGKTPQSFSTMDVMRLPLGILTGIGFIGGGAILRRGNLLTGVTTAATLWLVTVIGLCFGGGQLLLGVAATVVALLTLWAFQRFERVISRRCQARLVVEAPTGWSHVDDLIAIASRHGCKGHFRGEKRCGADKVEYSFQLTWSQRADAGPPRELIEALAGAYVISSFEIVE